MAAAGKDLAPTKPTTTTTQLTTDGLIARAEAMVADTGRQDLLSLLEQAKRRWDDPQTRVMVIGEFKQGKSALVNALLNAPVCRVGDDVTTAVPTMVSFSENPSAVAVDCADHPDSRTLEDIRRTPIDLADLGTLAQESEVPGRRLQHLEVELPRDILRSGLVLVDTPGVGGLRSSHGAVTVAALPSADAVLFASDATAEYSATEIDFLLDVLEACPNVTCVVTKTDLQPEWRRIVELNQRHLERAGVRSKIVPVSSLMRDLAIRTRDIELNEESGFAALTQHVEENLVGRSKVLAHRSVCRDVLTTCENLQLMLRPELSALQDPNRLPDLITELEKAKVEAQELKERSARWQTTLNDGMADLNSDLEHDLRDRMRALIRDCEASIDAGDPGEAWDGFSAWLEERCNEALKDTFTWAEQNTSWLVERVGQHFNADADHSMLSFSVGETSGLVGLAPSLADVERGNLNFGQKVFIGMRGSYGGVLMFGLLTSLAGMALVNPLSIGAGLLLGAKAYHDEKNTRLKRRQNDAKTAVRRYVDDVQFQVLKTLRDRLRMVQRALRDHYTARADEITRSLAETLLAARTGAKSSEQDRKIRIEVLKAKLTEAQRLAEGTKKALGVVSPKRAIEAPIGQAS